MATAQAPSPPRMAALRAKAEAEPDNAPAWNALGIAEAQSEAPEAALAAFEKALALAPKNARYLNNRGNALRSLDRATEARAAYDAAIAADPDYADPRVNRLRLANAQGDAETALADLKHLAKALAPGDAHGAIRLYQLAEECGRWEIARRAAEALVAARPEQIDPIRLLAEAEQRLGRHDRVLELRRRIVALEPSRAESLTALGQSLLRAGQPVEARLVLERAAAELPDDPNAQYWLGNALTRLEDLDAALACYARVAKLEDPSRRAYFAQATALIQRGRWKAGWALYDGRFGLSAFKPRIPVPGEGFWRGGRLDGKALLVHSEQGFGDSIMCARFLPLLKSRFGAQRVELLAEPALRPLLEGLEGVDAFHPVPANTTLSFDAHVPMLSLPQRFGVLPESMPPAPYLTAPSDRPAPDWAKDKRPRIGIVWAGRPSHSDDHYRSLALRQFAGLWADPGRLIVSLQMGQARAALSADLGARARIARGIIDHGAAIQDFGDSAVALMGLDLLVTVDTAVAHLAGALGRPVWLLLPMGAEWRWGLGSTDTPWYGSMRLYRQAAMGDWDSVFARLRADLDQEYPSRP